MTLLSLYLPLIYLAVYLIAVCVLSNMRQWQGFLFLTVLYLSAWIDPIWYSPKDLMLFELIVLSLMIFTYSTALGFSFSLHTFGMILVNGLALMLDWHDFWRLSGINLIFLSLCIIVIMAGYNARKITKKREGSHNGLFLARAMQKASKL